MASPRGAELDAALRLARSKGTLGLMLITGAVVGLFLARRDPVTAILALTLVSFLVATRIRSWARLLRTKGQN